MSFLKCASSKFPGNFSGKGATPEGVSRGRVGSPGNRDEGPGKTFNENGAWRTGAPCGLDGKSERAPNVQLRGATVLVCRWSSQGVLGVWVWYITPQIQPGNLKVFPRGPAHRRYEGCPKIRKKIPGTHAKYTCEPELKQRVGSHLKPCESLSATAKIGGHRSKKGQGS